MSAVAVLKIGSTTSSLLVAKNLSAPLAFEQQVVNLFEPDAGTLLDKTIAHFTEIVDHLHCPRRLAAGGQALREFPDLRNPLDQRHWPVWIPDGQMEGRLSWFAVKAHEPEMDWLLDVGGGSTELASATETISLPIGAATKNMITQWPDNIHAEAPYAIGGTAHALSILAGQSVISQVDVERVHREITAHPDLLDFMDSVRRMIFPQGLAVIRAVMEHYRWTEIRYSPYGFLHGIWLAAALGRSGSDGGGART